MAFSYYKALTIQTGQVPSSQSGFPALLPFLGGDANLKTVGNGGHVQSASGYDIRPYSDSALTSPLTFELVSYDATTGAFEMWVNMTAADGNVVYLAYGDSGITTDGSSSSTWDSNFKGVWHLNAGSSSNESDSTSNGVTAVETGSPSSVAAQIGKGRSFAAGVSYLEMGNAAALKPSASFTFSHWVKSSDTTNRMGSLGGYSGFATFIYFDWNSSFAGSGGGKVAFQWRGSLSQAEASIPISGTSVTDGNWHQIVGIHIDGGRDSIYVDGVEADGHNNNATIDQSTETQDYRIGDLGSAGLGFNGIIDEVHISHAARSVNWITTEYNNQSAPTSFWSTGSETAAGGGSTFVNWEDMPRPERVVHEIVSY